MDTTTKNAKVWDYETKQNVVHGIAAFGEKRNSVDQTVTTVDMLCLTWEYADEAEPTTAPVTCSECTAAGGVTPDTQV